MPASRTYSMTERFTRGDQYVQRFTLVRAGFDFGSTTLLAQVRAKPGGPVLATPVVAMTTSEVGRATGSISMDGDTTAALPPKCAMDIELNDPSSGFGPHTPVRVFLELDPDYTQA